MQYLCTAYMLSPNESQQAAEGCSYGYTPTQAFLLFIGCLGVRVVNTGLIHEQYVRTLDVYFNSSTRRPTKLAEVWMA